MKQKDVIGRETCVDIKGYAKNIPAKVDTGADSSAIWASDIRIDENDMLCFKLFDQSSPFYTGQEIRRKDYSVARVKSASGDQTIKFRTHLSIVLAGHKIKVLFGLSNRETHKYPILIGRRTLSGRFVVDVEQHAGILPKSAKPHSQKLNQKMQQDPQKFYQDYYLKGDAK